MSRRRRSLRCPRWRLHQFRDPPVNATAPMMSVLCRARALPLLVSQRGWSRFAVEGTLHTSTPLLQFCFILYSLEHHSSNVVIGLEPRHKRPFHLVEIGSIHIPSVRIGKPGPCDPRPHASKRRLSDCVLVLHLSNRKCGPRTMRARSCGVCAGGTRAASANSLEEKYAALVTLPSSASRPQHSAVEARRAQRADAVEGAALSAEEVNADGIKVGEDVYRIKLVVYDSRETASLVNRLIFSGHVRYIATLGGTIAAAVNPMTNESKALQILLAYGSRRPATMSGYSPGTGRWRRRACLRAQRSPYCRPPGQSGPGGRIYPPGNIAPVPSPRAASTAGRGRPAAQPPRSSRVRPTSPARAAPPRSSPAAPRGPGSGAPSRSTRPCRRGAPRHAPSSSAGKGAIGRSSSTVSFGRLLRRPVR